MKLLGIGSRINHAEFGKGVVTNVSSKHYWVTFIDSGLETIDIDAEIEIIEATEDDVDTVSFFDVESSLKEILKKIHEEKKEIAMRVQANVDKIIMPIFSILEKKEGSQTKLFLSIQDIQMNFDLQ